MQESAFDLPRYLAALPLFKDMASDAIARIAAGSRLRRLARTDPVFHVGEPCVEFCVTVYGQIKLFALSSGGQEKVFELVGPGMTFAEAPMFVGGVHRVNAEALADTLLLAVSRQAVLDEIGRDPALAVRMLSGLSRRLHRLMDDVEAYALHSGLQRVVDYLLDELTTCSCSANTVALPTSKATIALRLSLTPEYFSRVLHQLEAAGLVRIDKREISIDNPDCLRAFSSLAPDAPPPVCPRGQCAHWKKQRATTAA
jgi:CRP-like cAMP-binding protein